MATDGAEADDAPGDKTKSIQIECVVGLYFLIVHIAYAGLEGCVGDSVCHPRLLHVTLAFKPPGLPVFTASIVYLPFAT